MIDWGAIGAAAGVIGIVIFALIVLGLIERHWYGGRY